ncbi:MAG: DNA repair exonuclease SbcCD ATPase subunit [Mariniblastus sp.]|jgi:DNA repair exonuclease SbcCD ATPase subunit
MSILKDDSKREQFLLMLFPAALILAIYSVLFAVPLRQEKSKIETEYLLAQKSSVSPEAAENSRVQLANERDSLERIRKRVANSKAQIRELSQGWRSSISRLETLEKITELMQDYNLSMVSQGGKESVVVSTTLQQLFDMMNEQTTQAVEYWPVEVKGAYFDVLEFLTSVDTLATSIIPISITMQPETEGSSQKTWTIVFVI